MIKDVDINEGELGVDFDGRTVTFAFVELDTLVPAYARQSTRVRALNTLPLSSR